MPVAPLPLFAGKNAGFWRAMNADAADLTAILPHDS